MRNHLLSESFVAFSTKKKSSFDFEVMRRRGNFAASSDGRFYSTSRYRGAKKLPMAEMVNSESF